jgi:Tol biopolymer transport system component/DNA-binding winged helix-turn-helix (wHTH) protein
MLFPLMPRYRFGDVEFDPRGFRLTRAGQTVDTEPKTLEVLHVLLENRGRLVDKRELLAAVWRDAAVSENSLTRVIAQLRKAIGDEARDARYLETVPTRGYRFLAEVDVQPDGEVRPATPRVEPPATPPPRSRRAGILAAGGALLLVALAAGWWLGRNGETPPPAAARPVRRALVTSTGGFNGFPSISPDGASMAFVSDRTGRLEIYVKPLAPGGQEVAVTSDGQINVQPAWSPNGRFLAYHSMSRGGVWLIPALGGAARRLTEFGSGPAWSPDGKEIAFQSLTLADLPSINQAPTTLWVVSVDGGAPRALTRRGQPSGGHGPVHWSPDGRRLVFASDRVWTIAADGSDLRPVAGTSNVVAVVYGPEGRSLFWAGVVEKESRIFRTRLNASGDADGAPEELTSGGADVLRHLAISRDGRRVAFARSDIWSGIETLALPAGGKAPASPSTLPEHGKGRKFSPVFSRDGRRLAYMAFRPGAGAELWVRDMDAGADRQVLFDAGRGVPVAPDWFPDGERLFLTVQDGASSRFLSVSLAGETRPLVTIPRTAERTRLGADGRAAVFQSFVDGVLNVWRVDLQSGEQRQLTSDKEGVGWPVPSPDGRWLGVELFRGADSTLVSVMPADGGSLRPIVATPGQNWVHSWSADSRHLAFAARRQGVWNVYAVSLEGEERQLTHYTDVNSYVRYPAWSPRGDRIAYERTTSHSDVWVMDLD